MARRGDAHESSHKQGGLVPYGASSRRYALLPYERELCQLLGLSEEEYRWFKEQIADRNYVRPAEYDLIPDIRCDPVITPILINLAIGLAFTAISYLLAPKPPEPPGQVKNKQLASQSGRDRYAPIYGFDSVADIATHGESVPLVWTRYTGTTGGVVVAPKLIWSRLYSWGSFQTAKFLYAVGIFGVDKPDLAGIWLGSNALSVAPIQNLVFYWRTQATGDLTKHYGNDVGRASGDPSGHRFPSFSQAYTPSNNTVFGVSNAVANGTQYRVNWRVISVPSSTEPGEGRARLRQERKKICGWASFGMPGVGTGFARRQGLVSPTEFLISAQWIRNVFPNDVPEDDINSELDAECTAADEVFQIGEKVLIAGHLFEVSNRTPQGEIFVPRNGRSDNNAKSIRASLRLLEVVDNYEPRTVSESVIISTTPNTRGDEAWSGGTGTFYGIGYDPAVRFTAASLRTTRGCEVCEIGIKSNVWARFNGLCNFQSIPFPADLIKADADNVNFNSGTMTQYFMRTAVFTIRYRFPNTNGEYGSWVRSDVLFAVRGATPQDQYNWIRLVNPKCTEAEYQFVPLTGASIVRRSASSPIYWLQSKIYSPDDGVNNQLSVSLGGGLTAEFAGKQLACSDCQYEPRMWQEPKEGQVSKYQPRGGTWQGYRSGEALAKYKESWMYEVFGPESEHPVGRVLGKVMNFKSYLKSAGLKMTLLIRVRRGSSGWEQVSQNAFDPSSSDITKYGETDENGNILDRYERSSNQTSISPKWITERAVYYNCLYTVTIGEDNPFHSKNYGQPDLGSYQVTARFSPENDPYVVQNYEARYFETNTQCMEVSHYGNLINRSCDNQPEHQIVYVNEIRRNLSPTREGLALAGLSVKSARNITSADQLNVWVGSGTRNSNSFPELVAYLLEKVATNNNLSVSMVDQASISAAASYCNSNGLFFDGALSERQNLRGFIESTAPFFLLNMVIKNGKIGLQPAIPSGSPVAMFTAGNIIDGSLKVDYLPESNRRPMQAVVTYRTNPKNQLPKMKTIRASWADGSGDVMEEYDLSAFCTSYNHAVKVARYFMALRKYVTKTVNFQTTPDQARMGPGDFIQIAVQQTTVSSGNAGTITRTGEVVTPVPLLDGDYKAVFYKEGMDDVMESHITVKDGKTTTEELWGTLFAVETTSISTGRYVVDQLELDQDGLVNVQASEFPDAIGTTTFGGAGIVITPSAPDGC